MPEAAAALTVYGIPNCDQVKKTRRWLAAARRDHRFHDLRGDGVTREDLTRWLRQVPWTTLVNQKGSTWRNLPPEARPADEARAVLAMLAQPTLIKRPVVEFGGRVLVGFSEEALAELLAKD
jgi:Spx/MgsR family transcriptional regulator